MSTNIGREFLKLIDECFPKGHKLRKAFNRHTVKISYSTTPNMQQIISAKNNKTLRENLPETKKCSCTQNKKEKCPLQNKCLESEIVYQAIVEVENKETKTNRQLLILNTVFQPIPFLLTIEISTKPL